MFRPLLAIIRRPSQHYKELIYTQKSLYGNLCSKTCVKYLFIVSATLSDVASSGRNR
jgi:hypothetical protein